MRGKGTVEVAWLGASILRTARMMTIPLSGHLAPPGPFPPYHAMEILARAQVIISSPFLRRRVLHREEALFYSTRSVDSTDTGGRVLPASGGRNIIDGEKGRTSPSARSSCCLGNLAINRQTLFNGGSCHGHPSYWITTLKWRVTVLKQPWPISSGNTSSPGQLTAPGLRAGPPPLPPHVPTVTRRDARYKNAQPRSRSSERVHCARIQNVSQRRVRKPELKR